MFVAAEGCRRKLRPCRAVMRAKEMREESLSSSALQVCREKKRGETKKSPSTAIAGMWRGGWEKIVNGFGGWGGVWSWSWVLSSLRLHEVPGNRRSAPLRASLMSNVQQSLEKSSQQSIPMHIDFFFKKHSEYLWNHAENAPWQTLATSWSFLMESNLDFEIYKM